MSPVDDDEPSPAVRRYRAALLELRHRSWEIELLISGAVLFGLLRVVPHVEASFMRLSFNLGGNAEMAAFIVYEYVKLLLYTLILAFLAHLVTRAFWVGLVGLDSIFPNGPRWENLKYGPATIEAYKRVPRVRRLLMQADAVASLVFSFGFGLAFIFLVSVVWSGALGLLAWAVSAGIPAWTFGNVFKALAVALFVLLGGVPLVDRLVGPRLLARPLPARLLRGATRAIVRVSATSLYLPINLTLFSNVPKRRMYTVFFASLTLVLALFVVRDGFLMRERLGLHSHRFLPAQAGAAGVDPRYYEVNRQPTSSNWLLPSIPAEIAAAPYVRLFVPLAPDRVDRGLERHCPDLEPLRAAGLGMEPRAGSAPPPPERLERLIGCLALLAPTTLDGEALPAGSFLIATHPTSGARGLVAYLPTRDLAPGRHTLVVLRPSLDEDADDDERRHVIPFWL